MKKRANRYDEGYRDGQKNLLKSLLLAMALAMRSGEINLFLHVISKMAREQINERN